MFEPYKVDGFKFDELTNKYNLTELELNKYKEIIGQGMVDKVSEFEKAWSIVALNQENSLYCMNKENAKFWFSIGVEYANKSVLMSTVLFSNTIRSK